jgi:hypothetical protein
MYHLSSSDIATRAACDDDMKSPSTPLRHCNRLRSDQSESYTEPASENTTSNPPPPLGRASVYDIPSHPDNPTVFRSVRMEP